MHSFSNREKETKPVREREETGKKYTNKIITPKRYTIPNNSKGSNSSTTPYTHKNGQIVMNENGKHSKGRFIYHSCGLNQIVKNTKNFTMQRSLCCTKIYRRK